MWTVSQESENGPRRRQDAWDTLSLSIAACGTFFAGLDRVYVALVGS